MKEDNNLDSTIDFLFETGMLSKTPRSFYSFLGSSDKQSVADHINRVCYISYVLASLESSVNLEKVLKMALFHDITESRISDLNWVHQQYNERKEEKALEDVTKNIPFSGDIKMTVEEYEARESIESKIVKEADSLEFLLCLKEQIDSGNEKAKTWIPSLMARFKTENGKMLAEKIIDAPSDRWWFKDKQSDWWINRNKK